MGNALIVLNQKKTLYAFIIIAVIYEVLYGYGIGGLVIDFFVWFIGIGFILIPIFHAIFNLIRPDNTLKIEIIARINLSLIIGVLSGVLFGGLLNLGLFILGVDNN